MALGDPYATKEELKSRLGIGDTTEDTALDEAVKTASRWVEKHCRRQFNKATTATARVFYPDTRYRVEVDDFHTLTDLVIKTDSGDDGTYETTLTTSDYQLLPLNGVVDGESGWPYSEVLRVTGSFTCGDRPSVQVTAQWGWDAVPTPVKQATLIVAEETAKLKDAPFGTAGFTDFGIMKSRDNPFAVRLLSPYRRYAVLVA